MAAVTQKFGLGSAIVQLLRQYNEATTDFVAYRLNREFGEIDKYVRSLEDRGVIERRGEMLSLTPSAAQLAPDDAR